MERQYVGIDLHRRSSTIYRMSGDGEVLGCVKIPSQPLELAAAMAEAGEKPEVVLESTYGWYWAADLLQDLGAKVHLAHALGNNWGNRRVKNDERDARDLAAMLRLGRLAEGWIAPPQTRELRELVCYRARLVHHRSSCKAQIHGVMAKNGILPVRNEMWGPSGSDQLDALVLPEAYAMRIASLRSLIDIYDTQVRRLDAHLHRQLKDDRGYRAILEIHGVGKVLGAIFVAEIGDISRFDSPEKLCSWTGLTQAPRVRREGPARTDHQAGLATRALGGHRGHLEEPWRTETACRLRAHRRAPGQVQGPGGRGPQTPHPRLLRPSRRRSPLSRSPRGGVSGIGHGPARARELPWPSVRWRGRVSD